MHWIVQTNLHREAGHARLLDAFEHLGSTYTLVQSIPFSDVLLPGDVELNGRDITTIPEVVVDATVPTFAIGSYKLARIAQERGWKPGAFFANLEYTDWRRGWGAGYILNPVAVVGPLRDVTITHMSFVRPVADSKTFAGRVFSVRDFAAWKAQMLAMSTEDPVNGDTVILAAPPQTIYSETRVFIVAGRVVTASLYKLGGRPHFAESTNERMLGFAQHCADQWNPNPAYVMDIADTPHGLRIVEANCLSAAGFYAADMQKLVDAVESRLR